MKKKHCFIISFLFVLFFSACSEADLNPALIINKEFAGTIANQEELEGVTYGMYDRLTSPSYYGRSYLIYGEVRSDNCFANGKSGRFLNVGKMEVSPTGSFTTNTWTDIYKVVASANILIAQNPEQIEGNPEQIRHIIGQAYIIRALAHFDLLKLYGQQHSGGTLGIPYVRTYNESYSREQLPPSRATIEQNIDSIIVDIETGLSMMSEELNDGSKQFITTHAVNVLKARVSLYFEDWATAKSTAQKVVGSGEFSITEAEEYAESWTKDAATNSIFELAFSATDNNNFNSLSFIYRGSTYGDIEVLDGLVSIFDEEDVRATPEMIGYESVRGQQKLRNLGKYPSADYSDNVPLMRYEEVILILAEAKMELGESDALDVLNQIPEKRNAKLYTAISKENILKERRRELCFEGFRFDDLARTGQDIPLVDSIKQTHGGPVYGSYKFAFPIPAAELNANPNMVKNEGY